MQLNRAVPNLDCPNLDLGLGLDPPLLGLPVCLSPSLNCKAQTLASLGGVHLVNRGSVELEPHLLSEL